MYDYNVASTATIIRGMESDRNNQVIIHNKSLVHRAFHVHARH